MLREAKVIVPEFDNDGNSLSEVHEWVSGALNDAFGGVTVTKGDGAWRGPSGKLYKEPVLLFLVACSPLEEDSYKELRAVVAYVLRNGKQKAVYVQFPDGSVEIISAT